MVEVLACVLAAVETVRLLATVMLILLNQENSNNPGTAEENAREAVRDLEAWLSTFQAVLRDKQRDKAKSLVTEDLVKHIRDFTLDIEDAFDQFMFDVPHHFHTSKIRKALHEVAHHHTISSAFDKLSCCRDEIKRKIDRLDFLRKYGRAPVRDQDSSGAGTSSSLQSETLTHNIVEEEEMVGLEAHQQHLVNQLINTVGDQKRRTILVVGLGGSGKTFLVKNVYRNKLVKDKFDCHARVHVSPSCNVKLVVLDMLKQFCPGKSEHISLDQGESIHEKLHTYLEDKRYLVVLDDVWSRQGFIPFANVLPNNNRGSRIIVTARKNDVADAHYTLELHGLNQKEAWKLFCRKAFRNRDGVCPHKELESTSLKIIDRCEGLPLVIAQVGSLLSHKQKDRREWDEFYKRFDYEIGAESDLPVIGRILLTTFEDLPDNLKSCFLYLSLFPKGYLIKRGRLIRSWIAEGFVKGIQGEPLEGVAETYLNILIGRNLIQVSEWEIDGPRVRSFTVSSLFHELLVSMSKKGSFLTLSESNNSASSSEKVRHLSVQNLTTTDLRGIRNLSQVRTFFMFGQQHGAGSSSYSSRRSFRETIFRRTPSNSVENVSENFTLLKVLDMQHAPLKDFSEDIGRLVLLRCLNLSYTQVKEVPRSIKKLVFLETLNLKHTLVTNLPKGIYKLRRLRHLLASYYDVEEQGVEVSKRITSLSSLQELSLVKVNNEKRTIKSMGHLTQLRKLRLVGLEKEPGKEFCQSIQKMKSLSTLDVRAKTEEFVHLDYDMKEPPQIRQLYLKGRLEWLPRCISNLQSLVKVGLKGSKLHANAKPVEAFEALPSLMELEMVEYYTGEELVFRAGKFKSLKILHIEEFYELSKVEVENNAMPKLEKLTICKCKELKSVPLGIFDRKKPVEFIVYDMNEEFISNLQKGKKAKNFYEQDLEPGIGSSQYNS